MWKSLTRVGFNVILSSQMTYKQVYSNSIIY